MLVAATNMIRYGCLKMPMLLPTFEGCNAVRMCLHLSIAGAAAVQAAEVRPEGCQRRQPHRSRGAALLGGPEHL